MEKADKRLLIENDTEIWRFSPEERINKVGGISKFRQPEISEGFERKNPELSIVYMMESY